MRNPILASAGLLSLSLVPSISSSQTLLAESFDSLNFGTLNGQNGWFSGSSSFKVVPGGDTRPTPTSGGRMLALEADGIVASNLIQPQWNSRTAGNELLILEGDVFYSTSDTSNRSLTLGVSGNTGNQLATASFSGSGNRFFYGSTLSGLSTSFAGARNTWHSLRIVLDFASKSSSMYANGALMGTASFGASESINTMFLVSAGGSGAVSESYFDTIEATAVPEPGTTSIVLAGLAFVARRRKAR